MSPTRSVEADRAGDGHRIEFTRSLAQVRLVLAGDIDLVAVPDLHTTLAAADSFDAVEVDLENVTFIDLAGIEPLVEATRRRLAR